MNEKAARTVAGCVVVIALVALLTGWLWLTVPLALGFAARVLAGPRFSPLGQFATRVVAPRLGVPRLVAGPPKQFAQGMGLTFTAAAAVAHFGFGADTVTRVLLAMLVVAAVLESVFALCLGCKVFALLMRAGLVSAEVCEACNDISLRTRQTV